MEMKNMHDPANWKFSSPTTPGWHLVVGPDTSSLTLLRVFRLNLSAGNSLVIENAELELNLGVIEGELQATVNGKTVRLGKKDSVYLVPGDSLSVQAGDKGAVAFAGGAPYRGVGSSYIRLFEPEMPIGAIHQVHGTEPYRREIFMTIDPDTPASTMINGFTWGDPGGWTSWPPHQHTEDLEEVYCYFDLPAPRFALHLCSRKPAVVEFVHPVSTGDVVIIPEGYHPTVASPNIASSYFWLMAAHRPASRRYDLAVTDPAFA